MNKNALLIIAVIVVAFSMILYFVLNDGDNARRYYWEKTFEDGEKQPYDFGLLKKLIINKTSGKFEVLNLQLKEKLDQQKTPDSVNYLFIGRYCFYTKPETESLINFVGTGGVAMLIAEQFPDTLLNVLQENGKPFKVDEMIFNNVSVHLNNINSPYQEYPYRYRYFDKDMNHSINWNYLSEENQLDYYYGTTSSRYLRLGSVNSQLNFAKFKLGKGYIYLHTNPVLFTNYFLLNDTGFSYASHIFSELKTSRILYDIGSRQYKETATHTMRKSDTPLSYILKQPALKWAWYLLIFATLAFFLFKAKREQRIISVLELKRNTSMNFVETISGLYFNYNDHRKMSVIKMNLFTNFIRHKLGISTNEITPEVLLQISNKAKVPLHDTEIIFHQYKTMTENKKQISADELILLNQYIETFYKYFNSKKNN